VCVPSPMPLAGRSVMVCIPPEEAGAAIEGGQSEAAADGASTGDAGLDAEAD
jgi:hypothetical protein